MRFQIEAIFPNINRVRITSQHQKNEFKEQSILMIAYWFPPIKAVTLRSYYIYQEWKKYFKKVTVLTTSNQKRLPKEALPLDQRDVNLIKTLDYRTVSAMLSNSKTHFTQTERKRPFINFFTRLLDCFPINFLIGEGGFFYILLGYWKAIKLIEQDNPTYIYSSFRPYSDHIIAWLLKKKYPNLFWIADFRDLHVDHIYKDLYFVKFQRWCNRKIINKADLLTTVSEGLAEHLQKYAPPVYVLRNGYGQLFFEQQEQKKDNFQIAYTGSIYDARQSPELLLQVLAELIKSGQIDKQKIKLTYAGKDGEFWQEWMGKYDLTEIFMDCAILSREDSIKMQRESHLNLLLSYADKDVKGIITGKIYEYFTAKNAILAIINGEKDTEFESIFEDLNLEKLIYNQPENKEELRDYILNLYQEWQQNGSVQSIMDEEKLQEYQWENTIPKFLTYLSESRSNNAK